MSRGIAEFRERALREASRYGSDPWVFVRELLQNARDAGARSAAFRIETRDGRATLACADDGEGMTFAHARRFLFALYASSKTRGSGDAGRFGVGFWSVLRFAPSRIVVRSWPKRGEAWEVALAGDLTSAERGAPPARAGHGTEVLLERPGEDAELARRVEDAAFQSARFLRGRHGRALEIRVNGRAVHAAFALPAPSATFTRRGLRGVVGLGSEARVELFANGLRVRSAAALQDLATGAGSAATRVRFSELAAGLLPQAILDGERLEPLLARGDVRNDGALRRLVGVAERELARLVERQIALVRPEPIGPRVARIAMALVIIGAGALGARWALDRWGDTGTARVAAAARAPVPSPLPVGTAVPPPSAPASVPVPYFDLASRYLGPRADRLDPVAAPVALLYSPATARPRFAALIVEDPLDWRRATTTAGPYQGIRCAQECLEVGLIVGAASGPLRLPVPTGHRLDVTSLRVGDRAEPVLASSALEPLLLLPGARSTVVRYRTGPAPAPDASPGGRAAPPSLRVAADAIRGLPAGERAEAATAWVAERIAYSTSSEVVERHRTAAGEPFLERALTIGAGDCDVQNAVLTLLLQSVAIDARLAIGYLGEAGVARPGLHAWVEWRAAPGEAWRVADASVARVAPRAPASEGLRVAGPPASRAPELASPVRAGDARRYAPQSLLLLALAAGLVWWTRPRSAFALDPRHDVSQLLKGALQHPDSFRQVPALFERRLLPRIGGGPASLGAAWELASRRRLYRSARRSRLAREVALRGGLVIDAGQAEGALVADALGAIDLDAWDALLARAGSSRLLRAAGAALRAAGEAWEARSAAALGDALVLDLPAAKGVARVVVVDAACTWLRDADALASSRPAEAVFTAVDRLAELAALPDARRLAVLAALARAAILEQER